MLKIIDSEDFEIIYSAIEIIANIIKIALNGLKEGEQHPYLIQLSEDGTVSKLIQIFKNEDYVSIEEDFAEIFAFLYKNTPLPKEIQEKVVKVLKTSQFGPQIDNLCLLSECPAVQTSISSSFIAVCGGIPAEAEKPEFHTWLNKFGMLSDIWLEEKNGTECRQALALFSSEEGLNNALSNVSNVLFKYIMIKIERCPAELREIAEKLFIFLSIKTQEEEKNYARVILQGNLVRNIENISEIISDNFIASIEKLTKMENDDVKKSSVQFLLLLSEKGGYLEKDHSSGSENNYLNLEMEQK
ncbi:MAG: hypothetical protein EZS28_011565 [Streblomastix strix]|uniref:Uncharacterized protein n=1 Tax=Streblomastix strix TaxID=222440 RepID=A0A5J4WDF2_9EUKA|nr:MAG: hypothetical protein EZS28_011565 [Streblomastix strix]